MDEDKQGGARIVGNLLRWLRRRRRAGRTPYGGFAQPAPAGPLRGMRWHEFEVLAGDAFRLQGYSVSALGPEAGDDGADLVLRRNGKTLLVAYRHWNVASVGAEAVHDLREMVKEHGADGGLLLTLGRFSPQAQSAAQASGIEPKDGTWLVPVIQQAQATRDAQTAPAPLEARPRNRRQP